MKDFLEYMKSRRMPAITVVYPLVLSLAVLAVGAAAGYLSNRKRRKMISEEELPAPLNPIEEEYQRTISRLKEDARQTQVRSAAAYRDMIMYYKQISEGFEDQSRFETMQKVGMTKEEIRKSINSQMLTVFLIPIAFACIHLAVILPIINRLLMLFGLFDMPHLVLCAGVCAHVRAVLCCHLQSDLKRLCEDCNKYVGML